MPSTLLENVQMILCSVEHKQMGRFDSWFESFILHFDARHNYVDLIASAVPAVIFVGGNAVMCGGSIPQLDDQYKFTPLYT